MWCPQGFVLLSEVRPVCWELAERQAEQLVEVGELKGQDGFYWEVVSGLSTWLLARFVDTNGGHFFAALQNGRAVRLSEEATEVAFPIEEAFEISERNLRFLDRLSWDGLFAAIEIEFFTLDVTSDPERSKRRSGDLMPELLFPLNGCPICFPETLDFRSKLLLLLGATSDDTTSSAPGPGRRKVRLKAAQEYFKKYPEGHEKAGVSLSHAANRLGYDRRTLRDGIREYIALNKDAGE